MGDPKISNFIVSLIVFSMIIGVLGLFIAHIAASTNRVYDNSSFESYDKLEELTVLSEKLENKSNIKGNENALDVIGNYFTKGYQAVKLTTTSFSYFDSMSGEAMSQSNLGGSANIIRVGLSAIVLIVIIVGVFLAAIMKWRI